MNEGWDDHTHAPLRPPPPPPPRPTPHQKNQLFFKKLFFEDSTKKVPDEENENDCPNDERTRPPTPTQPKENWYVGQTRCEENENTGLGDRRPLERPRPVPTPPKLRKALFSTEIGTETKLGVRKRKMMIPLEIDTHLINYSRFVKTAPMDLKFDAKAKFNMENSKTKEKVGNWEMVSNISTSPRVLLEERNKIENFTFFYAYILQNKTVTIMYKMILKTPISDFTQLNAILDKISIR